MTSKAFRVWRRERAAVLDELERAHRAVGGHGPGRRTQTQALNEALLLRLAAEFQGFCRELYTEAVKEFTDRVSADAEVTAIIDAALSHNLRIDRGNAGPGTLGADFARLGLELWAELYAADSRSRRRNASLERLMVARNAIAHADTEKLSSFERQGARLNLEMFRHARRKLNALAGTMDKVTGQRIGALFYQPPVW